MGTAWALHGHCMGTVWALHARCMGIRWEQALRQWCRTLLALRALIALHAHRLHAARAMRTACTLQELSHLTDARLSLLVERREMVGALDGQPTRASFYKRHPEERGR